MNEIKTGMKFCRRAEYEKCQKGAGPETGQRDERNRNGHEILPRSRIRRMPKRFEHQLLRSKPDREWAREHAVDIPKGAEQGKCPEREASVQRIEQPVREVIDGSK